MLRLVYWWSYLYRRAASISKKILNICLYSYNAHMNFLFPNDINGRLHNLSEHIIESKFKLSLNIGWIQVVEKLCQTLFWAKKWLRLILDWEPLNRSTLCNKTSYRTRINSHGRHVFLTYLMWGQNAVFRRLLWEGALETCFYKPAVDTKILQP